MLKRIVDFVEDNRTPHHIVLEYMKKRKRMEKIQNRELDDIELEVVLTFDVEYDFGDPGRGAEKWVEPFLSRIRHELDVPKTFFMQANLISKHRKELRTLEREGDEIALHCWAHEPWGSAWFIKDRVAKHRQELMKKCLLEFRKAGLKKPKAFRAPYMVLDKEGFDVVKEAGFSVDSSYPSFRKPGFAIGDSHGIVEIPVSSDPLPSIGVCGSRYIVLNMHNLATLGMEHMLEHASNILKTQMVGGLKLNLVLLGHSWEFFRSDRAFVNSEKNFSLLKEFVGRLNQKYKVRMVRISDLVE